MKKLPFLFLVLINIILSANPLSAKGRVDFMPLIYSSTSIKDTTIKNHTLVTQHYLDSTRNLTKGNDSLGAIYTLLTYNFNSIDIDSVEWIYAEIEVPKGEAPVNTYYCVIQGFPPYYCGLQVNSPTERRVLFSVWDKNGGNNDANKVPSNDRAKLLSKGKGVL